LIDVVLVRALGLMGRTPRPDGRSDASGRERCIRLFTPGRANATLFQRPRFEFLNGCS